MNNYKVKILPKARKDLRRALNYLIYVTLSPKAAAVRFFPSQGSHIAYVGE